MNSTSPHTPPVTEEDLVSAEGSPKNYGQRALDDVLTAVHRRTYLERWFGDYTPEQMADTYLDLWVKAGRDPKDETFLAARAAAVADPFDREAWRRFGEMLPPAPPPALAAAPSLVVFDTSDLTRNPSGHTPTWKGRQRHLDQKLQPRVLHEQWTSRKDRRAKGDRRTAQQIAESIRAGQERS